MVLPVCGAGGPAASSGGGKMGMGYGGRDFFLLSPSWFPMKDFGRVPKKVSRPQGAT